MRNRQQANDLARMMPYDLLPAVVKAAEHSSFNKTEQLHFMPRQDPYCRLSG
jgi:hypothetical protein